MESIKSKLTRRKTKVLLLPLVALSVCIAGAASATQTSNPAPAAPVGATGSGSGSGPAAALKTKGTKCWVLDPVLGKQTFLRLRFTTIGQGHALFSGQAVRTDGQKPDRVLQISGSSSKHSFVGDGDETIERILMDFHYSFSKIGTDPANAFAETGAGLLGHYNVRLNPEDFSGVFEGRDLVLDWQPPLTGPAITYAADQVPENGYASIANNYLGGVACSDEVPGFNNCGTILPINNTGTLTLVGTNKQECDAAAP